MILFVGGLVWKDIFLLFEICKNCNKKWRKPLKTVQDISHAAFGPIFWNLCFKMIPEPNLSFLCLRKTKMNFHSPISMLSKAFLSNGDFPINYFKISMQQYKRNSQRGHLNEGWKKSPPPFCPIFVNQKPKESKNLLENAAATTKYMRVL